MGVRDELDRIARRHGLTEAARVEIEALIRQQSRALPPVTVSLDDAFIGALTSASLAPAPVRAFQEAGAAIHLGGRRADLHTVNVTALEAQTSPPPPPREAAPTHVPAMAAAHATPVTGRFSGAAAERSPERAVILPPRYEDQGLLGVGGMGEVRRVRDRVLQRTVAMKIIQPRVIETRLGRARFLAEAQATAQLQHPGVVPVHDAGVLPDGRDYYVMQQVVGRTLEEVIREVHRASSPRGYGVSETGWSFRRLMQAFHAACEAMAYAHARGVIHRDIKPQNVLVGAYGEVFVVDWGLMKIVGAETPAAEEAAAELGEVLSPGEDGLPRTLAGRVTGTPAYMSPEQARGQSDRMGPWSDVFSLGLVLYEILWGSSPYTPGVERFKDLLPQIMNVEAQAFPEDERTAHPAVPDVLERICREALCAEPDGRFPDAGALAAEIGGWLLGARNREQAMAVIEEADRLSPSVKASRRRAKRAREQAAERLEAVSPDAPVSAKREGWGLLDEAERLTIEAEVKETQWIELVRAALTHDPGLSEAHQRLSEHYRERLDEAERKDDGAAAARALWLLRTHSAGKSQRYLKGRGALTLHTEPAGAEAILYRYERRDRRMVAVEVKALGPTPLDAVELDLGSYQVLLMADGYLPLRLPVRITREGHWDGVPPGAKETLPVRLLRADQLAPGECYVPGGWTLSGAVDGEGGRALEARNLWVDAFVIQRHPVTEGDWAALLAKLDPEKARALLPALRGGEAWALGHQPSRPELPVVGLTWHQAMLAAGHQASLSGLPWRLPSELEWEKAARGVDGRRYPWGFYLDPTFCAYRASFRERPSLQPAHSFPDDESPYGVRGMAGNVSEWCLDAWQPEGPLVQDEQLCPRLPERHDGLMRALRGGQYGSREVAVTIRRSAAADAAMPGVSLRLLRPV